MKRITLFIGIVALFVACQKTPLLSEDIDEITAHLDIDFDIHDGTPETKGIKKGWAKGDKVYIFFDKEICNPPQYLVVTYNSGWIADSWSAGLESKIAKKKSGTLTALYVPNDKVYGTIDIKYKDSSSYSVVPKDKNGDNFYSFWSEAHGVSYTVSNGVLSSKINLKTGYNNAVQFCLPNKDRNGNTISNSTASVSTVYKYRFKYSEPKGSYGAAYAIYSYANSNEFFKGGNLGNWMNAYFYGGICFSCMPVGVGLERTYKFTLTDGEDTYVYSKTCRIEANNAYKLPALNAKDSNGDYIWEKL